jgi:hypothetical protein
MNLPQKDTFLSCLYDERDRSEKESCWFYRFFKESLRNRSSMQLEAEKCHISMNFWLFLLLLAQKVLFLKFLSDGQIRIRKKVFLLDFQEFFKNPILGTLEAFKCRISMNF